MTCAFAVRGGIRKVPGVESVEVSLNKGTATVKLKPGNTVKPSDLWETVRNNGFTPKETLVVVRGAFLGKKFKVSGTNQEFEAVADPKNPNLLGESQFRNSKDLVIRGSLTPLKDVKAVVPLIVRGTEGGR